MKDKELRKLIGSRAKQRRLELNLTQPYVAEKMGVTASTILRYENGSIDNTKKMVLEGLSEALHVSIEWLKGETDEYETESTESQYFISDADAWNTLRKQLATTARGCAVLYIKENCELPIINNTVLAKKRNFDCWKPVCAGQISKDFGEI